MQDYPDPRKQSIVLWVTIWIIVLGLIAVVSQCHG